MSIRPGPVVYFAGPDGSMVGFDADLLHRFAAEQDLRVRFETATSAADVIDRVGKADAHLGAGGLFLPRLVAPASAAGGNAGAAPSAPTAPYDAGAQVLWSKGYSSRAEAYHAAGLSEVSE